MPVEDQEDLVVRRDQLGSDVFGVVVAVGRTDHPLWGIVGSRVGRIEERIVAAPGRRTDERVGGYNRRIIGVGIYYSLCPRNCVVARLQLKGDVKELLAADREELVAGQPIVAGCTGRRILTRPGARRAGADIPHLIRGASVPWLAAEVL